MSTKTTFTLGTYHHPTYGDRTTVKTTSKPSPGTIKSLIGIGGKYYGKDGQWGTKASPNTVRSTLTSRGHKEK